MKTIKIQNCTDTKDKVFRVFINGEKHNVRNVSKIQVPDDKPFEIRAKYIFGQSPKYLFEPKDNMRLQITANMRLINWSWSLTFAVLMLSQVLIHLQIWFSVDISDLVFIPIFILLLFMGTRHFVIVRKKSYTIKEVNIENIN